MSILSQSSKTRGELTDYLCLNIETYMQEGSGNGAKGVSRVVIANQLGQRVFDTQIKLVNPAQTKGKSQANFIKAQA